MKGTATLTVIFLWVGLVAAWGDEINLRTKAQDALGRGVSDGGALQKVYSDWTVTCAPLSSVQNGPEGQFCEMRQEVNEGSANISVAMQIRDDAEAADLSIMVPHGLDVGEHVTVDDAQGRIVEMPFLTCFPYGCVVTAVIEPAAVAKLVAGGTARLTMKPMGEMSFEVALSLDGFADALNHLLGARNVDWGIAEEGRASEGSEAVSVVTSQAGEDAPRITLERPYTQIGLFRVEANARAVHQVVESAGLTGDIRLGKSQGRTFWRVLVGPARNTAERARNLTRLRGLGFKDAYHVRY